MGQQEGQVQHTGPHLVSCVHYSGASESLPFLLLSASCSLEIAKVAAKPECKSEALHCLFQSFPPQLSRAAGLDHRKSPLRRTAFPCSWSRLLLLLDPALPCLLASPLLVQAAAPCRRQQDLSKGLGEVRLGEL